MPRKKTASKIYKVKAVRSYDGLQPEKKHGEKKTAFKGRQFVNLHTQN